MTKHTKAPWVIEKDRPHGTKHHIYGRGGNKPTNAGIVTFQSEAVAALYFSPDSEGEANAHLISAAPEMLEALEVLVHELKKLSHVRQSPEFHKPLTVAHDAIKKAKGEA